LRKNQQNINFVSLAYKKYEAFCSLDTITVLNIKDTLFIITIDVDGSGQCASNVVFLLCFQSTLTYTYFNILKYIKN